MHLTLGDRDQAEVLARKAAVASHGLPEATALVAYLEATDPRKGQAEHLKATLKMIDMAIAKDPMCRRGHFYRAEIKKRMDVPDFVSGGPQNPMGARALYLFDGNKDTMFRIHGTNEPDTIGQAVSSGCIRMLNSDVIHLYQRVRKGARVVVL